MNCEECDLWLQSYVDRELPEHRQLELERHLQSCASCTAEFKRLSKFTTTLIEVVTPLRLSSGFKTHVMEQFIQAKSERSDSRRITSNRTLPVWPFLLFISLSLLAGLSILLYPQKNISLGRLTGDLSLAELQRFRNGWQSIPADSPIRNGDRVLARLDGKGSVNLSLQCGADAVLRPPCGLQLELDKTGGRLVLYPTNSSLGQLRIQTGKEQRLPGIDTLRIQFENCWVDLAIRENNECFVEPQHDGTMLVGVMRGTVKLGNSVNNAVLTEGFRCKLPQDGAISPAIELKNDL